MAAQAGLCLAWSETPADTFFRVVAYLLSIMRYNDDNQLMYLQSESVSLG